MQAYIKVYAETSGRIGDVEPVRIYFIVKGVSVDNIQSKVRKVIRQIDTRLFNVYGKKFSDTLYELVVSAQDARDKGYPVDRMQPIKVSMNARQDARGDVLVVPVNSALITTNNSL